MGSVRRPRRWATLADLAAAATVRGRPWRIPAGAQAPVQATVATTVAPETSSPGRPRGLDNTPNKAGVSPGDAGPSAWASGRGWHLEREDVGTRSPTPAGRAERPVRDPTHPLSAGARITTRTGRERPSRRWRSSSGACSWRPAPPSTSPGCIRGAVAPRCPAGAGAGSWSSGHHARRRVLSGGGARTGARSSCAREPAIPGIVCATSA